MSDDGRDERAVSSRMKLTIRVAVFVMWMVSLAIVTHAAPLPVEQFSQLSPFITSMAIGSCHEEEVARIVVRKGGEQWTVFFGITDGYLLVVYDPYPDDPNSLPTMVGTGRVDLVTQGAHDTIPPLKWRAFDPIRDGNATPCTLLFESEA